MPNLPILPILPQPYFLCVLGVLCGVRAIMQNKPNSQKPKTNATSYARKTYTNIPPLSTRKNKPKQTQSIAAKPAPASAKPYAKPEQTQLVAAKPVAKPDPVSRMQYPVSSILGVRNTKYDIPHPTYEIRDTLHACPMGEIRPPTSDIQHANSKVIPVTDCNRSPLYRFPSASFFRKASDSQLFMNSSWRLLRVRIPPIRAAFVLMKIE